jgi:hypothetical protein
MLLMQLTGYGNILQKAQLFSHSASHSTAMITCVHKMTLPRIPGKVLIVDAEIKWQAPALLPLAPALLPLHQYVVCKSEDFAMNSWQSSYSQSRALVADTIPNMLCAQLMT